MQRVSRNLVYGATGTTATATIDFNGIATHYVIVTPNFTNNSTTTISVKDTDGHTIYTGSAHNESLTALVGSLSIPVDVGYTITGTLSGDAGGTGGTVVIKFFIETRR